MRRFAMLVSCSLVASCGGPDGGHGDAGIDGSAIADAAIVSDAPAIDARIVGPPYETLPACDSPLLWELAPNHDGIVVGGLPCSASRTQPLLPLDLRVQVRDDAPAVERVCVRVVRSDDAGWTPGAIVEHPGDALGAGGIWRVGHLAGRSSVLTLDTRAVLAGGFVAASPVIVDATSAARWPDAEEPEAIIGVVDGAYATAGRVRSWRGITLADGVDVAAMMSVDGRAAWVERRGASAWIVVAPGGPSVPGGEAELVADLAGRPVLTSSLGGFGVVVIGDELRIVSALRGGGPPLVGEPRRLPVAPDELAHDACEGALFARVGDRALAISEIGTSIAWLAGVEGVEGMIPAPPSAPTLDGDCSAVALVAAGMLVPIEVVRDRDSRTERARLDRAIAVDPRIGRPIAWLDDGRVIGADAIVGRAAPGSPDSVTTRHALGGPIVAARGRAHGVDGVG